MLSNALRVILEANGAQGGTYIEPYAGGAGAAIHLLVSEHVDRIVINDADRRIYAFWRAALDQPAAFIERIFKTPLTIAEWRRQRQIYKHPKGASFLTLGFAAFYLNRCNRSGIISSGGPIGGIKQEGPWKIGARFNREELADRVLRLAEYRDRIEVSNLDALEFMRGRVATMPRTSKPFAYLDPPYFAKGPELYMNAYKPADHSSLAAFMKTAVTVPWVISYDDAPQIRRLYAGLPRTRFSLNYSANDRRRASELLIFKPGTPIPPMWKRRIPDNLLRARSPRRAPRR